MNRLSQEKSPYLRHAAHQKIDWYPWSDEAFERARQEDKPVFLSSGAVWCHWCHVMAQQSFENDEIAGILNERFVSVKLDRDERPDIDRRYQLAVAAMGNSGGWPLSIFLTPDRKPFYGGTYFPPEDSYGRPGFRKVLLTIADFYSTKRAEVVDYGDRLMDFLRPVPLSPGTLEPSVIESAVTSLMSEFDIRNGGFGAFPKFPMPGAVEFLMGRFFLTKEEPVGHAVKKTLEAMAKGGFHDQLKGGFHRYSTDEAWIIPHFEKMADDNSWLLRNYASAYALFGDEYFRAVAGGIIAFVRDVLSDPEGGFYASQDADVTPDDEGGYFTWTEDEFRKVLDEEEYRIISLHFFHGRGALHHDTTKKVLFIAMEPEEIAGMSGAETKDILKVIASAKRKLLQERDRRESPFIDRTFYTSLNGMMITAFLAAFRSLKDEWLKGFALKSLERILAMHAAGGELMHTAGVRAVLDDYVFLAEALLSAYEVTGKQSYLERADEIMGICIRRFWDPGSGGFFDTDGEVLGTRLKGIEDIPHPSPNAVAAILLLRLSFMTGDDSYRGHAEDLLKGFSAKARDIGIHAGYYFFALLAHYHRVNLTVQAVPGSRLAETAVSSFHPCKAIRYAEDHGSVIPCLASGVCLAPLTTPGDLGVFLRNPS